MYEIEVDSIVYKDLAKVSPEVSKTIKLKVYHNLAADPKGSNCKPLKGKQYAKIWRYRVGDYRVFYQIIEEVQKIIITRVKHRNNAY